MKEHHETEGSTSVVAATDTVSTVERIKALIRQRWERLWNDPLPSDDEHDQLLYVIGMIDGIVEGLHLSLSDEERTVLRIFAEELSEFDND